MSRVLIRCDATPAMGGGHAMRCLTLAGALEAGGAEVTFACTRGSEAVVPSLAGRRRIVLTAPTDAAEAAAGTVGGFDAVVIDGYHLDADYEAGLRRLTPRLVAIDDLVRPHVADMVIDQTYGRRADAYGQRLPVGGRVLAGAAYALLRPAFAAARPRSLRRRRTPAQRGRVLVSLGLTDVGGVTARVVEALLDLRPDVRLDVVLGRGAPSRAAVEAVSATHPGARLHLDVADMAGLMARADVAIGAGGTTSWERACLGLPAVLLTLADNQAETVRALVGAEAAVAAEDAQAAAESALRLLDDPGAQARITAAAAPLVDGLGAGRVAQAILGREAASADVGLRPVRAQDAEAIWLWRNHPDARAASRSSAVIPWTDHIAWFARAMGDPGLISWIAGADDRPVGVVHARMDEATAHIGVSLDPSTRGHGLGLPVLSQAVRRLREAAPGLAMTADIALDNAASRFLFEACGFRPEGPPDGRFARYRRDPESLHDR